MLYITCRVAIAGAFGDARYRHFRYFNSYTFFCQTACEKRSRMDRINTILTGLREPPVDVRGVRKKCPFLTEPPLNPVNLANPA